MSKVQLLRGFINQRLTAAAEEIFGLFERTISEYEEELCRSKEENQRHRKLLDAVFQPEVRLHRADIQQLLFSKEEVPPEHQQQWSPRLDQEDPPETPLIKEEQEDLWTSQEGEQLPGLEEADITKFPFTPDPVKCEEDDEEKPQSSQIHQSQTEESRDVKHLKSEADGEDCGGPEPGRNFNPGGHLQPDNKTSLSSETEDRNDVLKQRRERQPGLDTLKNNEEGCDAAKQCLDGKRFGSTDHLQIHMKCHTGEKTFTCSFCGKKFTKSSNLTTHLRVHTGEKPFTCSVCNTSSSLRCTLVNHMREYVSLFSTDVQQLLVSKEDFPPEQLQQQWSPRLDQEDPPETPLIKEEQEELRTSQEGEQLPGLEGADITKFLFTPVPVKSEEEDKENWEETREPQPGLNLLQNNEAPVSDQECNTGETSVSSSECAARFGHKELLRNHNGNQTGRKPFSCSVCGKRFAENGKLRRHSIIHTGEKPFSCSVCGKRFTQKDNMRVHSTVHTGEKPFSCSVCGKRFSRKSNLRRHSTVHTR